MAYRVYGRVRRSDNGVGIPGMRVKAYDVDWISSDDYLGSDTTDGQGNFEITFDRDAFDAGWYDPEGGPDIVVKVYNNQNRLVYRSGERSGAGKDTFFDIRLDPLDLIGQYTVGGRVTDARSGRVLCNLPVRAYDDDLIFDDPLGSGTTDHNGNYIIPYQKSSFDGWFEGNPDPYVKVRNDSGRTLAVSSSRSEAPRHSTIHVNIGSQEIERSISECIYGWTARYRQEGTHIVVRIRLNPDSGITDATMTALRNTWKTGIENKWSNRFACHCRDAACPRQGTLTFDVQWVNSSPHHTVSVIQGPARSNMTTWDTSDTGDVASHEFGHMLGLVDEYADAACPSRSPVNTGTVMDDNTEVVERHVEHLCQLLNQDAIPLTAPAELGAAAKLKAMKTVLNTPDKEKYAMCLRPDMNARKKIKASLRKIVDGQARAINTDRIVHTVSGGVEGKRQRSRLEISLDGRVTLQKEDQVSGRTVSQQAMLGPRSLSFFLDELVKSELLDLHEAGGPFVPDSDIGILTIEVDGNAATYYYLADPRQRRDQQAMLNPAVAAIVANLDRLAGFAAKRDENLQKKIEESTKKGKKGPK